MPHNVIPVRNITPTNEPITCANCQACCCQLEVRIVSDTGVPFQYIDYDKWGSEVMKRGDDGWCQALDRNTLMCTIYVIQARVVKLVDTQGLKPCPKGS